VVAFLLDANLSPKVAKHLDRQLGLDVVSLTGSDRDRLDSDILALARTQGRVIITLDRDFAATFTRPSSRPRVGVVYLHLPNTHRTVPAVTAILDRFFREEAPGLELDGRLTVVTETSVLSALPAPRRP
jgi:predicted nuclease of predicted toxin-antitoxin system